MQCDEQNIVGGSESTFKASASNQNDYNRRLCSQNEYFSNASTQQNCEILKNQIVAMMLWKLFHRKILEMLIFNKELFVKMLK